MTSVSSQKWISDVEDDGRLQELLGSGFFAIGFFAAILVLWGYALVRASKIIWPAGYPVYWEVSDGTAHIDRCALACTEIPSRNEAKD